MMIATNWGVYEFGKRDAEFRDAGDPRDMQIRARSVKHLEALRYHFPALGETVWLGAGVADFQYRVYITKQQLADMMYELTSQIDYVRFKEGAQKDHTLHGVLSAFWSTLLRAYPQGSSYTTNNPKASRKKERRTVEHFPWETPRAERKKWWED